MARSRRPIRFDAKRRYVVAPRRIRAIVHRPYVQFENSKPTGLWYAVGTEWLSWITSRRQRSDARAFGTGLHVHEITVDPARMLVLDTAAKVLAFNEEFGPPENDRYGGLHFDWRPVAERWAGIEIAPFQPRLKFEVPWYYGWDVASGCIWDVSVVTGLHYLGIDRA